MREVGKETPKKEMDNRHIFMTSHMTISRNSKIIPGRSNWVSRGVGGVGGFLQRPVRRHSLARIIRVMANTTAIPTAINTGMAMPKKKFKIIFQFRWQVKILKSHILLKKLRQQF